MALNRVQYINSFGYKGLYTDLPPDLVPPGALIAGSKNFRVRDGKLEVKHGQTKYAGHADMKWIGVYEAMDQSSTVLFFDDSKQYYGNNVTDITNTNGFNGDFPHGVSIYDVPSDNNIYVVASRDDIPQTWDGNTSNKFEDLTGIGSTFKATHVGALGNHLVFGNVNYDSTEYNKTVVWSDLNNFGVWPTEFGGTGTGSCGYAELYLTDGPINIMAPFQNYLLIGKRDAFILMVPTGISSAPYDFQWVTRGVGTPYETFAVLPTGVGVILEDDIILYDGTSSFRSIAHGKIKKEFFDNINTTYSKYIHSIYSPEYNEWRIYVNGEYGLAPIHCYIYRVNEDEWCYDYNGRVIYSSAVVKEKVYTIEGNFGVGGYYNCYKDDDSVKTDGTEPTVDAIDNGNCQSTSPPILTGETTLHGWNSTTYALDSGHGTWQRTAEKAFQGDYSWKYTNTSAGTDYIYFTDNYDTDDTHGLTAGRYYWLELVIWYDADDPSTSNNLKLYVKNNQGTEYEQTASKYIRKTWGKFYARVYTDDTGAGYSGIQIRLEIVNAGGGDTYDISELYVGSVRLLWSANNDANYTDAEGGDVDCIAITADRTGDDIDSFDRYMHTWLHYNRTGETSDEMTVNISTDQGDNWESPHTIDLSTDETRQRDKLEWNTAGRTVRTRFTGRKFTVYGEKIGFTRQGER